MAKKKRVRTIMYADQPIYAAELDLLNTPALQRLYDLHQLGLTDRVFIDASHSRLQHVIGVLEQADKITNAIVTNLKADPEKSIGYDDLTAKRMAAAVENRRGVIRLIGLLHDLTHAPFGHTVEDEINLVVCKHDEPARQADVFYRLVCQYVGWLARDAGYKVGGELDDFLDDPLGPPPADWKAVANSAAEMLTMFKDDRLCMFWRLTTKEILDLLPELHAAMTALLHLELLHKLEPKPKHFPKSGGYDFQWTIEKILSSCGCPLPEAERFVPTRDAYMLDVIGNTVCADLLDYAHRDSHFANIKLAYDTDRIAENFTLVGWDATAYRPGGDHDEEERRKVIDGNPPDPFATTCIRTAISLFTHKLRTDTLGELMNLLNVRFYLYERVIFNPTKCAADAMLGTALQLLGWRPLITGEDNSSELLPNPLRQVGDSVFLESVATAAKITRDLLKDPGVGLRKAAQALEQCPPSLGIILARNLTQRRDNPNCQSDAVTNAEREIQSGLLLLNRLRARRFYRPVFRMLPNAEHEQSDTGQEALADKFADAETRFKAERAIEKQSGLPVGSIVIHCPEAEPARKVADALVVGPTPSGYDRIRKVRHIAKIDEKVFGEHQEATEAVSKMYKSMWRLVVYVAPEFLPRHDEIAKAAGSVILNCVKPGSSGEWPNDPNLEREFRIKCAERGRLTRDDDTRTTELVSLVDEVIRELHMNGDTQRLDSSDRDQLKQALLSILAERHEPRRAEPQSFDFAEEVARSLAKRRGTAAFTIIKEWTDKNSARLPEAKRANFILRLRRVPEYDPPDAIEARLEHDLLGLLEDCIVKTLDEATSF